MKSQYKIGNVGYIRDQIRIVLNKAERGSMSREEASRRIIHFGEKLAEIEYVYEPDEVLDLSS